MRCAVAACILFVLLAPIGKAQDVGKSPVPDEAFWAAHWERSRTGLFGPDEQSFYENVHDIMFRGPRTTSR